jgi:RNAse (barnase) inhibitor barstar
MIVRKRELVLNGADWATEDDVYDAFFHVVGAPEWHGRNLDPLADSIAGG